MNVSDDAALWQIGSAWGNFVLRGVIVFFFVFLILRLSGKRQIGQMTPFDLVLLLLISNAVQNAMNGGDNSITAGLLLAFTLVAADWVIGLLARKSRRMEKLIEGEPELLVHNGHVREHALERAGISRQDLLAALRAQGCANVTDIHAAVLETNGHISVMTRKERG